MAEEEHGTKLSLSIPQLSLVQMINNVTKNPKNNKLEINSKEIWLSSFHKNLKQKQGCNLVPKLVIHFNENFVNFCHTVLYL